MQNMRFVNIFLLWDFRSITYFMYQKWARQSLLEANLKHCRLFILYLHSGQNSCFSQSKNLQFFTFYFSTQTNWQKIHEFEVCLLNPYKQCLRKIVSNNQKFLFSPNNVCNGSTFDTLNKAFCIAKATTDSNAHCVGPISWQVVASW